MNRSTSRMQILMLVALLAGLALLLSTANAQPRRPGFQQQEMDPAAQARLEQLGSRGIRIHDPSTIVKCKDTYWVFCTGRGTPSYYSQDLITWEHGPRVFTEAPAWTAEAVPGNRGTGFWAPDVIYHRGKYLLFFSVSTFGSNTSAIGVTTNVTLDPNDPDYQWTDAQPVIQSNPSWNFNAIDPAAVVDQEGNLWLAFGSFWSGIQLIQLNPDTGTRIAPDSPITPLAHYDSIEAAHIYFHDSYYYLFVDWGMCCRGAASTYNMRVGRSKTITGPYLDKAGKDMLTGGGSLLLATEGDFIGPGHPGIWKEGDQFFMGMHFYNGALGGASQYAIRLLNWDDEGWPFIVEP